MKGHEGCTFIAPQSYTFTGHAWMPSASRTPTHHYTRGALWIRRKTTQRCPEPY